MTNKTRDVLTLMRDQFRANHNDERADALDEILTADAHLNDNAHADECDGVRGD